MFIIDNDFNKYIKKSLKNETTKEKDERIEMNREFLKDLLDESGCLKVYRGAVPSSRSVKKAISWTYDINIATWFAMRNHVITSKMWLLSGKIHIEDILLITNERNEHEVIILPPKLGGKLDHYNTELISYVKEFMEKYVREYGTE